MKYFSLSFLLLLLPGTAAAQNYTLMAPLGSILSGSLDLTTYLKGAVTVIIGIAGLLAVSMTVFCGIRLMMSQSASGKSAAKECIWNAIVGLLLAIGAWILLYTINPLLLSSELNLTDVALAPPQETAVSTPAPTAIYRWSTKCETIPGFSCAVTLPSNCSGAQPSNANCYAYTVRTTTPSGTGGSGGTTNTGTTPSDTSTSIAETPVTLSSSSYSVNESASSITITVTRNSGIGAGSVDYHSTSAGATPDQDYRDVFGTLTFAEGVTTRTFGVTIMNDTAVESEEKFSITLSNPQGAVTLGTVTTATIRIVDNDPPTALDTLPPAVVITSPEGGRTTTLAVVPVTFTASDNQLVKRLEYVYAPPSPALASTHIICNTDCDPSPMTMTVPVAIDVGLPGTHIITVNVCDSRQCFSRGVAIVVEAPCVSSATLTCKILPTGLAPAPPWSPTLCSSYTQTTYDNEWEATAGNAYAGTGIKGISVAGATDAWAFKLTSTNISLANRTIAISGGSQNEYAAPVNRRGNCPGNPQCYNRCVSWSYNEDGERTSCNQWKWMCPYVPPNIIFSISAVPGDLTSTTLTTYNLARRVSGYCGNANTLSYGNARISFGAYPRLGNDEMDVRISATQTGAGTCRVEFDRTYYLNITTIPYIPYPDPSSEETEYAGFVAMGNTLYSLFWNFLP